MMERMQSMFSNAYNTPAGQLVEKATASHLMTEDWGLNLELCDVVRGYPDGSKDAVKAIKRRLSSTKNFNQICLTLSLMESCVKNCGIRFHVLVTTKDFCHDTLLKLIQAKNNPPIVLEQRILGIIKQYAEAFGSHPHMTGVSQVYRELQEKGVEFPEITSLEGIIGTAEPDMPRLAGQSRHETSRSARPKNRSSSHHAPTSGRHSSNPSAEQITKLRKDIGVVDGNLKVFSEMLTELNPSSCDPADIELMQELNRTCRAMQQRVVELIEQVGIEEITVELLRVNDDLNNTFLRYERFERFRKNKDSSAASKPEQPFIPSTQQETSSSSFAPAFPQSRATLSVVEEPPPSYSDTEQPTPEVSDLIDLSADTRPVAAPAPHMSSLTADLTCLNLSGPGPSEALGQKSLSEQLDAFGDIPDSNMMRLESTENEIEQWLSANGQQPIGVQPAGKEDAVTDDFSAFLNERATAAESLPNVSASSSYGDGRHA